ncbi:MAG: hypothetical protein VZR54_02675 [Ruminococcus sp.]|jgi:metal-dependent amidase/aminoacylase/carboxypeptidase family protein|nr:hypothetical protein [Ruminococcus sp.]
MKDVIKELVDIDEKAKIYNEETRNKKLELEQEIREETERIREKYIEDAKKEVENQKKMIEAEGEEKYNKSKKLREEQAQALKKKFDENADKWVEQIVGDVLA